MCCYSLGVQCHVLPINIISVLVLVPCINGNWYVYKINVPVVTGIQMNMCSQLASYTMLLTDLELLSF